MLQVNLSFNELRRALDTRTKQLQREVTTSIQKYGSESAVTREIQGELAAVNRAIAELKEPKFDLEPKAKK